ncbi:hypothetical protein CASFOL_006661 [Castilleja foliolosa]|uniref:F-box domain-containing protein n=1 Tax=Castilleja foliolosa TaxID=1961234 RepID=A0ABD3E713_9LAMI
MFSIPTFLFFFLSQAFYRTPKMHDIPLGIWRDILLRLPAESLFRLRAVSKSWKTIIDDPCFVKAHNKNQLSSNTLLLRNSIGPPFYPLYYFDLQGLNFTNGPKTIPATPLNLSRHGLSLVAALPMPACNGLMLLSPLDHEKNRGREDINRDSKGIWEIWNPLTRERLRLPQPNIHSRVLGYGIGYDCDADDYKVVVIDIIDYLYDDDDQESLMQTHVYSLKSDSWRIMIEEEIPFEFWTLHCLQGVFLNGALHWISGTTDYMIIGFDIGTEKYSFQLKLPDNLPQLRGERLKLDAFGECLFLSCKYKVSYEYGEPHQLGAWVMNDYGAEGSWIHLFSINVNTYYIRLVAYLKNKKQVLLQYYYGFVWFDVESCNSMKIVGVHGLFHDFKLCAHHFIGSLVRLHDRCESVADKRRMRESKGKMKMKMKMEMVDNELTLCVRDYGDDYYNMVFRIHHTTIVIVGQAKGAIRCE